MKKVTLLTSTAAIMAALAAPAFAQSEIAAGANVTGLGNVDRAIRDVQDDVQDDFDRSGDPYRFGMADRREGLSGSMSLSYAGRTGNTENQDLLIGGRVSYNQNQWAQSVGLLIEFTENDDGSKDEERVRGIYDAMYNINERVYAFGLASFDIDGTAIGDDLRRDGFIGVGPGYRILNTEDTAWRVQAGVGYRYTQSADQRAGLEADSSSSDLAYIVSSRLYHRFNDSIFITNDTDYLGSGDLQDRITNELGVNFAMSEQFATRVSYTTDYLEDRAIRTDNKLGVSVVYGF